MEVLRKRNCSAELTCDVVYSILHPTKLKNMDILNVLCLYIVYINLDNTSRLIKVKQYIFLKFFFKISALNQVIFRANELSFFNGKRISYVGGTNSLIQNKSYNHHRNRLVK